MRFHITAIAPQGREMHGLQGYREPIETLHWGLKELGHDVEVRTNAYAEDRTNIVFGIQMATPLLVDELPRDTIVYQLEQMAGLRLAQLKPAYQAVARRLRVWDYSERNLETWHALQPVHPPLVVPIGWAPTLTRIPKRQNEDIDVLLYGSPGDERFTILKELGAAGVRFVFACGLYGAARDELISRAKIVLNINRYSRSRIFEVVRTSYLLANAKAVVADLHPNTFVEPDLRDAVAFAPLNRITATCLELLENEPARRWLEARGPEVMRRRDIRNILRAALQAHGA